LPLQEKKWSQSGICPVSALQNPESEPVHDCVHNFLEELPKQQHCNCNASTTALAPGSNHAATAHAKSSPTQQHCNQTHRRPHSHQVQITLPPPTPPAELFAPLPSINYRQPSDATCSHVYFWSACHEPLSPKRPAWTRSAASCSRCGVEQIGREGKRMGGGRKKVHWSVGSNSHARTRQKA